MKRTETTLGDQSRWNELYGKRKLAAITDRPERFIIDPTRLTRQRSDLINAIQDLRGKRVLEFGSGRGEFSVVLAKLGAVVTGIDIGDDLIQLSRRIGALNEVECEFVVGRVDKLPFGDGAFDSVVGNAILHHLTKEGVRDALSEAYRVLRPGGMALFYEPIENSKAFHFVQNLVPAGRPHTAQYRPSMLQREEWAAYIREADDRALSNEELTAAKGSFAQVEFLAYYGLLIRLGRVFRSQRFKGLLQRIDVVLTDRRSPVRSLSQSVLVAYTK